MYEQVTRIVETPFGTATLTVHDSDSISITIADAIVHRVTYSYIRYRARFENGVWSATRYGFALTFNREPNSWPDRSVSDKTYSKVRDTFDAIISAFADANPNVMLDATIFAEQLAVDSATAKCDGIVADLRKAESERAAICERLRSLVTERERNWPSTPEARA